MGKPTRFEGSTASGWESPALCAYAVVPNDAQEFETWCRGLYVGGAGDIRLVTWEDFEVTFVGVLGGTILPIAVKKIFATGTTATNIVGLY